MGSVTEMESETAEDPLVAARDVTREYVRGGDGVFSRWRSGVRGRP